jgi:hypothetical protein
MNPKIEEMHWPGIEPGPPAWQASILPLNHQCLHLKQKAIANTKQIYNKRMQIKYMIHFYETGNVIEISSE